MNEADEAKRPMMLMRLKPIKPTRPRLMKPMRLMLLISLSMPLQILQSTKVDERTRLILPMSLWPTMLTRLARSKDLTINLEGPTL